MKDIMIQIDDIVFNLDHKDCSNFKAMSGIPNYYWYENGQIKYFPIYEKL